MMHYSAYTVFVPSIIFISGNTVSLAIRKKVQIEVHCCNASWLSQLSCRKINDTRDCYHEELSAAER